MRQSSEAFMEEMLKDNADARVVESEADRIAKIIDDKMEKAMQRFKEEAAKVNPPAAEVETPEESEEIKEEGEEASESIVED